jgi:hypothetical protein
MYRGVEMKLSFIVIALSAILFGTPTVAIAETPCTHLGHDRLQDISACLNAGSGRSRYLNNHHIQMVSSLGSNSITQPHPFPSAGNEAFHTSMAVAGTLFNGYRYGYQKPLVYPWSTHYMGYYPNRLPTDIISYIE